MFGMFEKHKENIYPRVLMAAALSAVFLSAIGYLGTDIWLASTQWLLIAAILALFGIYLRLDK